MLAVLKPNNCETCQKKKNNKLTNNW